MAKQPLACNGQAALLDHALAYARRGWSIIPVVGKKSVGFWKPFQEEPADAETLRRLFARKEVTGLAVVLGNVSGGLAVRDFDKADAYHSWAAANPGDAAKLPTVKTARGYHVYGRLEVETYAYDDDGELRGDSGHYVLLPPSLHPDGPTYSWIKPLPCLSTILPLLPPSLLPEREKTQPTHQPIACVASAGTEIVLATLPDGPGQRNRKVFDLARRLKALPNLDTSPAALKAIVTEWHRQALPLIRTKDFGETWSDFQIAWIRVKMPWSTSVTQAFTAASSRPLAPIDGNEQLGLLAALCRELQRLAGDQPFFLSCRKIASQFGINHVTAWRWLGALEFHGVIKAGKKGIMRGRLATEWRYTNKERMQ